MVLFTSMPRYSPKCLLLRFTKEKVIQVSFLSELSCKEFKSKSYRTCALWVWISAIYHYRVTVLWSPVLWFLLSPSPVCRHLVKEILIIPERLTIHRQRLAGTPLRFEACVRHKESSLECANVLILCLCLADDGTETRHENGPATDSKEYCSQDKDIVEVVRTEYVYTRPPPWSDVLPTIHVITPTYSRPVQKAELTRLANTFLHVPNLHWILVEDSQRRTPLVTRLLRETGLNYTHLNVETPRNYKLRGDTRDPRIPRGTMQRNLALRWLRETFNSNSSQAGIVYFADDDNTYSLELFEEVS